MVDILDTDAINMSITNVCENSRKYLVIICPFLKFNDKLCNSINSAVKRDVKLTVIYGKTSMDKETYEWLKGLPYCNIGFLKNLHAKLVLNEEAAVMSSMNLYEYSQVNNEELGMLAYVRDSRNEYKDLLYESIRLINASVKQFGKWDLEDIDKPIRGLIKRETYFIPVIENHGDLFMEEASKTREEKRICHCIRCGHAIPSTHDYVYCGRCFESWKMYCNPGYVERGGHCYICGKECQVSAERPSCSDCYKDNVSLITEKRDVMMAMGK